MAAADVIHQLAYQLVRVDLGNTLAGPAVLDLHASMIPRAHQAPEATWPDHQPPASSTGGECL